MNLIKAISVLVLASAGVSASGGDVEHRRAQITQPDWLVGDPTVVYNDPNNNFELTFTHGNGDAPTEPIVEFWGKECPNGIDVGDAGLPNSANGAVTNPNIIALDETSANFITYVSSTTIVLTPLIKQTTYVFAVSAAIASSPDVDYVLSAGPPPNNTPLGVATATFCVRNGLHSNGPYFTTTDALVNFAQAKIIITYNLLQDFDDVIVTTQAVTAADISDTVDFEVESILVDCLGGVQGGVLTGGAPFPQGSVYCVEVCLVGTDAAQADMAEIRLAIAAIGLLELQLVAQGLQNVPFADNLSCSGDCCYFEMYLLAAFYQTGLGQGVASVRVFGEARLTQVRRLAGSERVLQKAETVDQEFELSVPIIMDENSGTWSLGSATMAVGAVGAGAAALLI